jgi:DNA repair protein RadC
MNEESNPTYRPMIRDLPEAERPRERLKSYGASSLSNAELIAILLRTGVKGESAIQIATKLLIRFRGLDGIARASFNELCSEKGISEAKACQVLAALELGRRLVSLQPEERVVVQNPRDIFNLLQGEMSFLDQEHLRVVLLNTRNQVLGICEIYVGNVSSAVVRAAEVLRPAVRENCTSIILVHNHPSGDPTPSLDDIRVTEQVGQAGKLLDIELLDHIVLGRQRFVSLKEQSLGFK